jgi:hypothetical protein
LTKSTSLLPLEKPLKSQFLEGSAPLCSVRECWCSVLSSGGALEHSVPHSEGALPLFWVNFGLLREIREESPQSLKVVGFESEVKPRS